MKKYKNLYINGCSFTAGDNIKEEKIWPQLLAKKLKLNLINCSKNANSLQSIVFTSVNHLSDLSKDDTLVVIGLTWPSRYMIQFKNVVVNITSADLDRSGFKPIHKINFSTFRRISSAVLTLEKQTLDKFRDEINFDESDIVLGNFIKYYKSLLTYDTYLEKNQNLNYVSNLILLQSFLKQNNFEYKFVNFNSSPSKLNKPRGWLNFDFSSSSGLDFPICKKIDETKIIKFENLFTESSNGGISSAWLDAETGHPSEKGCRYISEVIFKRLSEG